MEGGALTDLIYDNFKQFKEPLIAHIMKQILQGLA
jgi:serine/threonine protein kinase